MSYWCKDIERDEAVRAAEDGRQGPLPTLEECIERVTERRPPDPRGGENVTPAASGDVEKKPMKMPSREWFERRVSVDDSEMSVGGLASRVAELESAAKLAPAANDAAESNHEAPAASVVPDVVRDMTDIIRGNATDDEKHAAVATLVEAVCPGWRLAPAASGAAGTEVTK